MDRYVFTVDDLAYCCWEHGLDQRNETFLRSVDAEFFSYVATVHEEKLGDADQRQRAAIALRTEYHHGLETLFSLLGALVQAPGAVPAWLPKCSTESLRNIVRSLSQGTPILTQCGLQSVTCAELGRFVHRYVWRSETPADATGTNFGRAWSRFADDFLNKHHVAEYNCLKHGFRVRAGGFSLRFGAEPAFGVSPPESEMRTLGSSPFGTTYHQPEAVLPGKDNKHHFRIRETSLNWSAEAMVGRLHLIAWSINNIVGCLRCLGGAEPGTIKFYRPDDSAAFEQAWNWPVGVHAADFDLTIDPNVIKPDSRAELRLELENRAQNGPPS